VSSESDPLILALAEAMRDLPLSVLSAYLFGSRAEGRSHSESDIDVGVLLSRELAPTQRERFDLRVRIGSQLVGVLKSNDVDVVVLNDAPPLLARRIVTGGHRVFVRDDRADHAFVRDVQLRAADLEPFLRRTRRTKLAAMAR
jgi:predicted nucleotidyltransferase